MSPAEARFETKVDRSAGPEACHLWTKAVDRDGYGQFWFEGRQRKAHRMAWFFATGEHVPDGDVPDHRCKNHGCVNVKHLQIVTHVENVMLGDSPVALAARRDQCIHGHPLDGLRHGGRHRFCRTCHREAMRKYRAKKTP